MDTSIPRTTRFLDFSRNLRQVFRGSVSRKSSCTIRHPSPTAHFGATGSINITRATPAPSIFLSSLTLRTAITTLSPCGPVADPSHFPSSFLISTYHSEAIKLSHPPQRPTRWRPQHPRTGTSPLRLLISTLRPRRNSSSNSIRSTSSHISSLTSSPSSILPNNNNISFIRFSSALRIQPGNLEASVSGRTNPRVLAAIRKPTRSTCTRPQPRRKPKDFTAKPIPPSQCKRRNLVCFGVSLEMRNF